MKFLLILLLFSPLNLLAVNAPTGLTASAMAENGSVTLSWNNDSSVNSWQVYINDVRAFLPSRQTVTQAGDTLFFNMPGVRSLGYDRVVVYLKASAPPPAGPSVASSAITVALAVVASTKIENSLGAKLSVISGRYQNVFGAHYLVGQTDTCVALSVAAGVSGTAYAFVVSTLGPCTTKLGWRYNTTLAAPGYYHPLSVSETLKVEALAEHYLHLKSLDPGASCDTTLDIEILRQP